MQRIIVSLLIIICCFNLIGGINQEEPYCIDETPSGDSLTMSYEQNNMNEWVSFYLMSQKDLVELLNNGSISAIKNDDARCEKYKIAEGNRIEYIGLSGKTEQLPEGIIRIGAEPTKRVFCKLLELCVDIQQIKDYLNEKGIEDIPNKVVAVSVNGYPLMLWIECLESSWVITVEPPNEFDTNKPLDEYQLNVYSIQECMELICPKELAVYVNGELVSACDAKLYGQDARIAIMKILKTIDKNATLTVNGDKGFLVVCENQYVVSPSEHKMTTADSNYNLIQTPPGGIGFCGLKNEDVYFDFYAFSKFMKLLGASTESDFDSLTIFVWS